MGRDDVVVMLGAGAGAGVADDVAAVVAVVVVSSSLQPNQPGVLQVDVEEELDEVDVCEPVVVL